MVSGFVEYANQAEKKVYFTDYANQADVKIFFVEYANQAKWVKKRKAALLLLRSFFNL